jgi:SEC-C motif-containing protein
MKFSINAPCPCGSGIKYKKCCGVFHKGVIAKTALELMKSRYTAFAIGKIDYIIKTSTFQKDFDDLKSFSNSCKFKKLEILEFLDGSREAYVIFRATIFCDTQDNSFTEKSRFIKENGKWYYESGQILSNCSI